MGLSGGSPMLVAQCPECGTAFQVSLNELNLAEGRLQCGHCHAVFHAEDPLLEAAGAEEKAAQIDLDEVDLVQNQSANDTAADAQTDWEVDPVAGDETGNSEKASRSPNSETSLSDATDTGQIDLDSLAEDSVSLSGALDSPEAKSFDSPEEPSRGAGDELKDAGAPSPAEFSIDRPDGLSESDDIPVTSESESIALEDTVAPDPRSSVTAKLGVQSHPDSAEDVPIGEMVKQGLASKGMLLLLTLLLIGQLGLWMSGRLQSEPKLYGLMKVGCELLSCDPGLYANINDLTLSEVAIEVSDDGTAKMSAKLGNLSRFQQALPLLSLKMLNSQGRLIGKALLEPGRDYRLDDQDNLSTLIPFQTVGLNFWIQGPMQQGEASSYQLELINTP